MVRGFLMALIVLPLIIGDIASADETIELTTGAKPRGTISSVDADSVTVEAKVGSRSYRRSYPKSKIAAVIVDGKRMTLAEYLDGAGTESVTRSKSEIQELIQSQGMTPPEWYDTTPLNYPPTLDLSWPDPAPKPWNSSKNVGQYIWDRINPNPGKWQEGVKLMHHIMAEHQDDRRIVRKAMRTLGTMYHNLHEDYARAAFWYERAGIAQDPSNEPNAGVKLANSYFQLGSQRDGHWSDETNDTPSVFGDQIAGRYGRNRRSCQHRGSLCPQHKRAGKNDLLPLRW